MDKKSLSPRERAAYSDGYSSRQPDAAPEAHMPRSIARNSKLRDAFIRGWYDAGYNDSPPDLW